MALGDLVQMLEGLPRGDYAGLGADIGDVVTCPDGTQQTWTATLMAQSGFIDGGCHSPCCGHGEYGAMDKILQPGPTTAVATSAAMDWTPWILGGMGLLTVWALFFRQPNNLR
jgi:hypothetical protein